MGSTPGTPSGQPGLVNLRQFCELMEDVLATRRCAAVCGGFNVSLLCMPVELGDTRLAYRTKDRQQIAGCARIFPTATVLWQSLESWYLCSRHSDTR
jgi:hypothetical protein